MAKATIIDTDAHVVEPADLWTARLPAAWGDRVMHVVWDETAKSEVWRIGDKTVSRAWAGAMFDWPEPYPSAPHTLEDAHPATYDVGERLKAMDAGGLRAAALYPNIAGLFIDPFVSDPDRDLSLAHVRAYNDWLTEWTSPAPERFITLAVIPYWDVEASVVEIHRAAGGGHRGIVMTGAPQDHDQPYLGDPHWDPIWAACQEARLPVSFHVANGDLSKHLAPERMAVDGHAVTYARTSTCSFLDNGQQLTDLLLCGVLARFPDLKFVAVESGIGWIPFVLESCDYHFKKVRIDKHRPEFGDLLPSDLFRRQVFANYWFERLEPWHVDAVGADRILFETDFPHPTCLYGDEVTSALQHGLEAQPVAVREKILWRNAADLYGLAPSA